MAAQRRECTHTHTHSLGPALHCKRAENDLSIRRLPLMACIRECHFINRRRGKRRSASTTRQTPKSYFESIFGFVVYLFFRLVFGKRSQSFIQIDHLISQKRAHSTSFRSKSKLIYYYYFLRSFSRFIDEFVTHSYFLFLVSSDVLSLSSPVSSISRSR